MIADRGDQQQGYALIAVLLVVSVLSLIAVVFLSTVSTSRHLRINELRKDKADGIADAAVARAVLALLDPRPLRRWRIDGTAYSFSFGQGAGFVSIDDELGKIDLNRADEDLIDSLLQKVGGLSVGDAQSLTDKILDWRDTNTTRRLNGAKARDYRIAGYSYGPRNGPFQSVDELMLVMGMTDNLFKKIEPALTVYSQRSVIRKETASKEALLALPYESVADVNDVVARRRSSLDDPQDMTDSPQGMMGRAFTIHAHVTVDGVATNRTAVVRILGAATETYVVLYWR